MKKNGNYLGSFHFFYLSLSKIKYKMLKIIDYIKENGLEKALREFKLKSREYDNKVLIKYDQIDSSMGLPEVQDSRGLILEKGTWNILCLSFRKFFNSAEGHAAKIDWNTARILEKLDGSMIQLYWDWNKETWFAATTGTAEGEGEVNNKLGLTFNSLFMDTIKEKYGFDVDRLDRDFIYVFELTTPYNIVVKPHAESSATILAIRNRVTLKELTYDELIEFGDKTGLPVVKAFDLNAKDAGAVIRTLEGMPWSEEGYVIVDGNFNRVKIKNPAYVAVHHLKSKTGEHNIMGVVKTNEIEEFAATFPERRDEIFELKENYDKLVDKLEGTWDELSNHLPKNITKQEQKKFAMKVFEIASKHDVKNFATLFFGLKDKKVESVKEFMFKFDNKKLYNIL